MPSVGVRMRGHGSALERDSAAPGALRNVPFKERYGGGLKLIRCSRRVLDLAVKVTRQCLA